MVQFSLSFDNDNTPKIKKPDFGEEYYYDEETVYLTPFFRINKIVEQPGEGIIKIKDINPKRVIKNLKFIKLLMYYPIKSKHKYAEVEKLNEPEFNWIIQRIEAILILKYGNIKLPTITYEEYEKEYEKLLKLPQYKALSNTTKTDDDSDDNDFLNDIFY